MSLGVGTGGGGGAYINVVGIGGMVVKVVVGVVVALGMMLGGVRNSFDRHNVSNIVKEMVSERYEGRLAGTEGNILASEYIAKYFKEIGLKGVYDKGSYFQEFYAVVPSIEGDSYFKVFNNNRLVKEYRYGVDFKEIHYGLSSPGTVKGKIAMANNPTGKILLCKDSIFETPELYKFDEKLLSKGIRAVIAPLPTGKSMGFKEIYKLQDEPNPSSNALVKILVSPDIIPELIRYSKENYSFEIKSSLINKRVKLRNVIGVIEGRNKNLPPIILSAHFDHVGCDSNKNIYPGALDNASGTAFIMECARVLNSMEKPKRTIIIAAFNANEIGLIGSKVFLKSPPLNIKDAECINFDMIGSKKDIPISIAYSLGKIDFAKEIANIAKDNSINKAILKNDFSDHLSFNSSCKNAITISQMDLEKIHTIYDNTDNVSDNLKDPVILLNAFLRSRGISPMPNPYVKVKPILNYDIYISISGAFIVVILIHLYKKKPHPKR